MRRDRPFQVVLSVTVLAAVLFAAALHYQRAVSSREPKCTIEATALQLTQASDLYARLTLRIKNDSPKHLRTVALTIVAYGEDARYLGHGHVMPFALRPGDTRIETTLLDARVGEIREWEVQLDAAVDASGAVCTDRFSVQLTQYGSRTTDN